jgi:hypothetical protein
MIVMMMMILMMMMMIVGYFILVSILARIDVYIYEYLQVLSIQKQ